MNGLLNGEKKDLLPSDSEYDDGVGGDKCCDNGERRVLSVQSSVVWGHVGNQISSFLLQVGL